MHQCAATGVVLCFATVLKQLHIVWLCSSRPLEIQLMNKLETFRRPHLKRRPLKCPFHHKVCPTVDSFLLFSYRCIAVNAAHTVEIDGGQTLIRQAVVKAASWTIATLLVCVVQRHLKHIHVHKLSRLRNPHERRLITVISVISTVVKDRVRPQTKEV